LAEYSLRVKQSAQKELGALDSIVFSRLDRKILALAHNPRPQGCKKLRGYKDQWRIRSGDWRVIYTIDGQRRTVTIARVAHRSDAYDI
jgi:mRNA interferase RelE/StbE